MFPFFTNHTIDHSEQVLLYCNILAGNDIVSKLNKDEVYILLIGAVLHDVGMGISEENFHEMSKNIPELTKYIETHQGQFVVEYTRAFHHDFSAQYIYKYSDLFEIPSKEYAHCIAQVAKGHRKYSLLFVNFLSYKLSWRGKKLIKVDRYFPSSKLCSICGYKNDELTLFTRSWVCPKCGKVHDRDVNAAINIKNEGLRLLAIN